MADAATVRVRVVPRAGRTGFAGTRAGAVLIRLAAAPVDGAANDELLAFLSRALACPRRSVSLVGGERSRDKVVQIDGMTREALEARLQMLTASG